MIGNNAIDLFGHLAIEGAQARLDMRDGDVQLGRRQRAGERGIGVAVDHQLVGLRFQEDRFDLLEHASGLRAVAAGTDAELIPGFGNAELLEEDIGHVLVIVLASVDEDFLAAGHLAQQARDDGRLDELGACADDGDDFHDVPASHRLGSTDGKSIEPEVGEASWLEAPKVRIQALRFTFSQIPVSRREANANQRYLPSSGR